MWHRSCKSHQQHFHTNVVQIDVYICATQHVMQNAASKSRSAAKHMSHTPLVSSHSTLHQHPASPRRWAWGFSCRSQSHCRPWLQQGTTCNQIHHKLTAHDVTFKTPRNFLIHSSRARLHHSLPSPPLLSSAPLLWHCPPSAVVSVYPSSVHTDNLQQTDRNTHTPP